MSHSLVESLWEAMVDRVGEDLRVVTRYDATDFTTKMREDVRERYDREDDRQVVDDTIVKQLSLDDTESAFDTGRLQGFVRIFEDAYVLSWTADALPKKSGVIVSIDRDGDVATLDDLEWCVQHLESEIPSRID